MHEVHAVHKNLRLKGAIVCEALLRLFRLPTDYFDGDFEAFVIYMAIVSANVSRFLRGEHRRRYASLDYPGEEERLPVSRRAIAASVGLPRETVRRKIAELIDKGHVVQVRGGLLANPPALEYGRNLDIVLGALRTFERTAAELRQSDEV